MTFSRFEKLCIEKELECKMCSSEHWQIKSGLTVNFYPSKGTVHINGTSHGKRNMTAEQAIQLAEESKWLSFDFRDRGFAKISKRKSNKERRAKLYAISNLCHICGGTMSEEEATLDHIHPISLGGRDVPENWALAHEHCNKDKGQSMGGLIGKFLQSTFK